MNSDNNSSEGAFEVTSVSFDDVFAELQTFQHENNGSLVIPVSHPALTRIIDSLTSNCIELLVEKRWNDQMIALTNFKEEHGNCHVPATHPTLGKWVGDQRDHYKLYEKRRAYPLTKKRYQRLKNVGLNSTALNRWDVRFQELKEYREQNGHCDVPIDHSLGIWVLNQRYNYSEMPQERIDALDNVDFIWNQIKSMAKTRDDSWNVHFAKLMEFSQEHGHTNVPTTYGKLGSWVAKQHFHYNQLIKRRSSPLSRYRVEKLEEVGFQWRINDNSYKQISWDERFEEVKKFKEQHGHCNIPRDHPYFGTWPHYQRTEYNKFIRGKKCKIRQDKVDKLVSIGFFNSCKYGGDETPTNS